MSDSLHLMKLTVLERIPGQPFPQSPQAIADDTHYFKAVIFQPLDAFNVIFNPLFSVDEFRPDDAALNGILYCHDSKIPSPISCISQGDNFIWRSLYFRNGSRPYFSAYGTSGYAELICDVLRTQLSGGS